jgi:hypothetical protein
MNDSGLTINKGCFNCAKHMKGCNGNRKDIDEILINAVTGEKYRCGCCCLDYRTKRFVFR